MNSEYQTPHPDPHMFKSLPKHILWISRWDGSFEHPKTDEPRHVISNNLVYSDEPVQPPFKLKTRNDVRSVALHSQNILASSKGSGSSFYGSWAHQIHIEATQVPHPS